MITCRQRGMLMLGFLFAASLAPYVLAMPPELRHQPAVDHAQNSGPLHGGKSLDQWIAQAKSAPDLEDRHNAMQVVRNFGLRIERAKTLRVFTELLSDDAPTIRSLAAAGLAKAGRPTEPKALDKLVELLSQDLTGLRAPQRDNDVGDKFVLPMREVAALGKLGNATHIPVLKQLVDNKKIDPFLHQMAKKAIQEIETRKKASDEEHADAIRKLEFLVGTWKSVEPESAPPSPETRTITMQPNGLSLTVTTETNLGNGNPVHIIHDLESREYRLTHTDAEGEKRVFAAELNNENRVTIRHFEGKKELFSELNFVVSVTDDLWTEKFEWPEWKDPHLYQRTFVRQPTER